MALGFGIIAGMNTSNEMDEMHDQVIFLNNLARNTNFQGMYSKIQTMNIIIRLIFNQ